MNMAVDEARIGEDEYRIAYNVRNRFGDLRPTKRPLKIDGGLDSGNGAITSLTIGTGGTGYSGSGNLTAVDPASNGSGFTGTYTVSGGVINTVTITAGGLDYSEGTTISISGSTSGAAASIIPTTTNNKVPFQAVYAVGDFLIIVQRGAARFKHRLATTWVTLWDSTTSNGVVIHSVTNPSLLLDTNADYIYMQAVPGSTMNIHREAADAADSSGEVILDYVKTGWVKTVAGLIVQDGVNQPNLIIFSSSALGATATSRKCKNYAEWDATTREYVPIGKQMMFFGGKLYVVGADGKVIYHSVSGRPLDFVIAIDNAGAKVDSSEAIGGAPATSYSVSYEAITCIAPLNTESFFVSTRTSSYAIAPNYTRLLFGEPMFAKYYLFGASVINQFSFVDVLGDFAFIDAEGMRSFNAVQQLRNEGRNSAFSLKVAKLFEGVVQTQGAAISFDNYTFFSVETIYGYGVLVFDGTLRKFVSLDLFKLDDDTTTAPIMQFSKIDTNTTHEIYGITTAGELLRLYSGAKYSDSFVQTRAFQTGDIRVEQKPIQFRVLMSGIEPWEYYSISLSESVNYSPNGTSAHTSSGTMMTGSAFVLPVEKIPYNLASGTEIFFIGDSTNTGGTFTLTVAATAPTTRLTGTLTSTGVINKAYAKGFVRFDASGTLKSSLISNTRKSETPGTISKTVVAPSADAVSYNEKYPLMWNNENKLQQFLFSYQQGRSGLKLSYTLEWNTSGAVSMITADTLDLTPKNPLMTQAYGNNN
jgi:hypothetical protein